MKGRELSLRTEALQAALKRHCPNRRYKEGRVPVMANQEMDMRTPSTRRESLLEDYLHETLARLLVAG